MFADVFQYAQFIKSESVVQEKSLSIHLCNMGTCKCFFKL